ncbi:FG-GAP repeat domain-containing protein [Streptomyces sp. Je 1-369]|uniref:FG-GAP repeat domain-containing protein n=1 Tax=Streptomyces sp. Je 1-369 TaxID=2966192 RepID=UPI0022859559|nr:VCBS repeat-containing protein [Streptomyces sp. Je 1-369]WAL94063.1 VCBS repeat-containing protein [Streptomyces sp. Je 1-369]
MLRKRSRLIAAPVAAVALTLTVTGYQASAAGTSDSDGTGRSVTTARAAAPCLSDATTLLGDLDGDGRPDRIANPGLNGTKMTVQWGAADGSFGTKQNVGKLVGVKRGEVATAAVADFQKDGKLDLVVNIVEPSGVDDPATARVADYRPGPLKRADLTSARTRHLDIGDSREAKELRIANYGDDAYPDLAILGNAGDGVWERNVRLSKANSGPGNHNQDHEQKYGAWGTPAEPPAMPGDGWKHFYTSCS